MPAGDKTIRLTAAQAMVRYLGVQFSERDGDSRRLVQGMFGIFGHGNVAGLGQALYEYGDQLQYYQTRNEQSMVHTASGFAKANRRLATLACTSSIGPGATNMITGAATATINRLPVLLVPSDYYATRYQGPVLQQLEHPVSAEMSVNDCFVPVSRFFDRITRPEQLLTALPEAMRVLTDPAETGAVTISFPQDIQAHAYNFPAHFFERREWRIERRVPDQRRIDEAVTLIAASKRPLIIAGGGVLYSEAEKELCALVEDFGIPVSETFAGKGAGSDSGLCLGGQGVTGTAPAGSISSQADLVIAIGTRMADFTTGSQSAFNHPEVKFISINVAGHDAHKQGGLSILADARLAMRFLHKALDSAGVKGDEAYVSEVASLKERWAGLLRTSILPEAGEVMSQGQVIEVLNGEVEEGETIVSAAGTPPGDLLKQWDASGGRHCHIEFGYSCMGYEIPAGIGVRMARPQHEAFVFIGDGTYLMSPSELVTALQENLKITVIISENHGFQSIWNLQKNTAGREFGNEFRARDEASGRLEGDYLKIDFAANAESFGARTWRAANPEELKKALGEARDEIRACVIIVETEPHHYLPGVGVWWDVAAAEVSQDPVTRKLRDEFEKDQSKGQRFHY